MAGAGASEAQVKFEDVIVYFSKEEWEVLEKWQKELYWDVLKDNYELLIVIGNPITKSEFIAWFQRCEWQNCIKSRKSRAGDPSANGGFRQVTSKRRAKMIDSPEMVVGRSEEEETPDGDFEQPSEQLTQQGCPRQGPCPPPLGKATPGSALSTYSQEAPKPYRCRECGKRFQSKGLFCIHQRVSLRKLSPPCPECGVSFPGVWHLRQHQRIHSHARPDNRGADCLGTCHRSQAEERCYFCADCGESFHRYLEFLQHRKSHDEVKLWPCAQCSVTFMYQSDLEMHEESHLDEVLPGCAPCGENCICEPSLLLHFASCLGKRTENSGVDLQEDTQQHWEAKGMQEKPYLCHQCGQRFRLEANLKIHYRYCYKVRLQKYCYHGAKPEHQKVCDTKAHHKAVPGAGGNSSCLSLQTSCTAWACAVCSKNFTSRRSLHKHRQRHRVEEPRSAAELNKSVSPTSAFGGHVTVSVTKKLHRCQECGKGFVYKWQLLTHVKAHAKENHFPCPFRRESIDCRSSFWKHLRTHSKEGPHSGKRHEDFGAPALAVKRRRQGEKKLYLCDECGHSFTKAYFPAHQAWHAGVKFKCLWCGKLCNFRSTGYRHLQHHKDKGDFLTCPKCGNGGVSKNCLCMLERIDTGQKPLPPPHDQQEMSQPPKYSCGKHTPPDSYSQHIRLGTKQGKEAEREKDPCGQQKPRSYCKS